MLEWNIHHGLPTHILLTKADKLKPGAAQRTLRSVQEELAEFPEITLQLFSSLKRQGIDEAHEVLDIWFDLPVKG